MIVTGLDIETTGLDPKEHRIVEVAALSYELETEKLVHSYVQRVNPQRSIQAEAQRVHGISLADLQHEPTWDLVAPIVHDILENADLIVAHNGDAFDVPFINSEFVRIGYTPITRSTFDTMIHGRQATPIGKVPNLGELCFAYGIDYDPSKAHAAEYDVSVMCQAFFNGLRWGHFAEVKETLRAA